MHARFISLPDYQHFLKENQDWLDEYAIFKTLKKHEGWRSWTEWPFFPKDKEKLLSRFDKEVQREKLYQFLCFQQLEEVKREAEKQGVFLKGDIPILLSRESSDVWFNREIFMMEFSAGSAPDMYASEGQNWGFPIYNWPYLEKQNYRWWKRRLEVASKFYHLYRLDHVVGFFRIWAIPAGKQGTEGRYYPENRSKWVEQGKKIMTALLDSTSMLPIGEDLGNVPPEVRKELMMLGICGTKVIRWERDWHGNQAFIPYKQYPVASMTTVSTHDSETLTQWWTNQNDEAKMFAEYKKWHYTPHLTHKRRKEILVDSHHTSSLFHINLLQEYLALVPGMTWPNPDDERINIPGIVSPNNWTYRFLPSVNEIIANNHLKDVFHDILSGIDRQHPESAS